MVMATFAPVSHLRVHADREDMFSILFYCCRFDYLNFVLNLPRRGMVSSFAHLSHVQSLGFLVQDLKLQTAWSVKSGVLPPRVERSRTFPTTRFNIKFAL